MARPRIESNTAEWLEKTVEDITSFDASELGTDMQVRLVLGRLSDVDQPEVEPDRESTKSKPKTKTRRKKTPKYFRK